MLQLSRASTTLKTIMIVVVLAVVVSAGWVIWKNVEKSPIANSYQSCVDAGNQVLLSYPSVCVTKEGGRFVNPNERVN